MQAAGQTSSAAAYRAAVAALYARRPERLVRGLERIRELARLLGDPQRRYPVVHVTGTNGKTSIARMVSALLRAHGLRVGTYISPHLQDVRERVQVDSRPIPPDRLLAGLTELAPILAEVQARRGELVTFFETMTALAFRYFAEQRVDVAVLEVGKGGRLDATNLADGRVAVLGPIGLDHPELGSRVAEVAAEKAGIIKAGAVAVSARQEPDAAAVVAEAVRRTGSRSVTEGCDFGLGRREPVPGGQRLDLSGITGWVRDAFLPLYGAHQAANAALALAAAEAFVGFDVGLRPEGVRAGLAAVRSPGRLELVRRPDGPAVLLDGAHNPGAARTLAAAVRADLGWLPHRVIVLGVLGDKDVDGILQPLLPLADEIVLVPAPDVRAAPVDRIADAVRRRGHTPVLAPDVGTALDRATAMADPHAGLVVVTGSLYTVGAARDTLGLYVPL